MNSWFKNLVSLDELKVSLLAISLIGILILDGFMAIKYHDVPPQLTSITITIISAVAGFNAISVVAGNITANKTNVPVQNSNMYNSNMYGYGMNQPTITNQTPIINPNPTQVQQTTTQTTVTTMPKM
ncbi:hypothetical protein [Paenibacillus cremeus]|uniref:Uncharacterized protein n=1 Tax=Paenibacillus cremeus TaxID=2163881 RepID=A0A559KD01_9BACL|nr:hypothetical protein [Paenibacillus cremeus]TVY09995.1 hypothetical protein FPZ49_11530 [Paenibacillus cremeus]